MNREERWVGGLVALSLWYYLGWYTLPAIPLCARLWAMGGASDYDKNWRRLGIPTVLCGLLILNLHNLVLLVSWPLMFGVLTMGYGIPGYNDEGSWLGGYYFTRCGGRDVKATIMTRATIFLLLGISLLPLAFINVAMWSISVQFMMMVIPAVIVCIN